MTNFSRRERYSSVAEATEDVLCRVNTIGESEKWIAMPLVEATIPQWTEALRSFSANSTVTAKEAGFLEQIRLTYECVLTDLEKKASALGFGHLNEFEPEGVLFIALIREYQRRYAQHVNLNQHKLRVLLDGRYSIEETE